MLLCLHIKIFTILAQVENSRAMAEPGSIADNAEVWLKPLPDTKSDVWKFFGFAMNEYDMIADEKHVSIPCANSVSSSVVMQQN